MITNNRGAYFFRQLVLNMSIIVVPCVALTSCNNNAGGSNNIEQKLHLTHHLTQKEKLLNQKFENNNLWQEYLKTNDQYLKANIEPPVHMGTSYDSRTSMPKRISCLVNYYDPNNVKISNPQGSAEMSSLSSAEEISKMMNIGISGKGGWGPFSASISAQYLENTVNNRQDMHFNYHQTAIADISYNIQGLGNNILSKDARDILERGEGEDGFATVCGDSFVASANVGATLYVDIIIHFDSAEHRKSFDASIQGKAMSIASVAAEFKNASSSYAKNSTISVAAMQSGGNAQKLAKLFGDKKPDGNYPIVDCAGGEVDKCVEILNGVIKYAQEDFAEGIDFTKPDNLTLYNYSTANFKDLDVKAKFNPLSKEAEQASLNLIDSINQDKTMLQYLNKYSQQTELMNLLPRGQRQLLADTIATYQSIVHGYDNENILEACYGPSADDLCTKAWDHIENNLHPHYADAMSFASDMSDTIVVQSPMTNDYYYALVPLIGHCNNIGECSGLYALYEQREVTLTTPPPNSTPVLDKKGNPVKINTVDYIQDTCYVDTTANNSYFAGSDDLKKYVGKSIVCNHVKNYSFDPAENPIYVARIAGNMNSGNLGEFVNGTEKPKPNSLIEFKYSGRGHGVINHLLYNPI